MYILNISPLSDMQIANIFSQLVSSFSLTEKKVLSLMKSNLLFCHVIGHVFVVMSKNSLMNPRLQ